MEAYIRGLETKIPEIPIYKILQSITTKFPNRVAIVSGSIFLSYKELLYNAYKFASYLFQITKKGERICIALPNSSEFAIAYYGTLIAGCVFVGCNPLLSEKTTLYILNDSEASFLITWSKKAEKILKDFKGEIIVTDEKIQNSVLFKETLKEKIEDVPAKINPRKDIAHILYTGGTTGIPKGVMLTHYNVTANIFQGYIHNIGTEPKLYDDNIEFLCDEKNYREDWDYPIRLGLERVLVISPWTHSMGITSWLNQPISWGATIYILDKFEPMIFLQLIKKESITVTGGSPTVVAKIMTFPSWWEYIKDIRMWFSGASPLYPNLFYALQNAINGVVVEGYGLTEASPGVSRNPSNRSGIRKPGSVGIPYPNTEIKIVDENGNTLERGEVGEILVKGPQVMKGYWKKPEETKEVLENGWLRTGDLGKIDKDGYLYVEDRVKDVIKYKGYSIYPRKIEGLMNSHPSVEMSAVVGEKDETFGEIPVCFVVLKKGVQITERELMDFVNKNLEFYEKVRKIIIVDSLPISEVGKILKRELRNKLTKSVKSERYEEKR
ncbi:MAG: AMP-binding protein [Nitrososphaeria archaeon]